MKRHILIADCHADGLLSFAKELSFQGTPFEIKSHIANWKRSGRISELARYTKYFCVSFLYFLRRKNNHALIGWQQFYALIFCFYCSLFHVKKCTTVVALNFTYKPKSGIFAKPYRWFMGKCVTSKYLDFLHVLSANYAEWVHREFNYPSAQIIISSFGVNDNLAEFRQLPPPVGWKNQGYALAIGRSNRDYDFLIRAWEGIDFPLVIISDTYKGTVTNERITLLSNIAEKESHPWIMNCALMIIPIDDGRICSGDTVLLTAMSLERKIIVTTPSTLAEMYVTDNKTAVLTPKNIPIFQEKVRTILFTDEYHDIGVRARESYMKSFSLKSMGTAVTSKINCI